MIRGALRPISEAAGHARQWRIAARSNTSLNIITSEVFDSPQYRVENGWASTASYADPMMRSSNHADINAMIEGARAHFPGHYFDLKGNPDGHGQFVRFSRSLRGPNGDVATDGTDIARLDDSGRIADVIGILDSVPA